jgi:hypothetical protein
MDRVCVYNMLHHTLPIKSTMKYKNSTANLLKVGLHVYIERGHVGKIRCVQTLNTESL